MQMRRRAAGQRRQVELQGGAGRGARGRARRGPPVKAAGRRALHPFRRRGRISPFPFLFFGKNNFQIN